jgi:LAO/AO transport system kinase
MPEAQRDNSLNAWIEEILRGDARAVARAISSVENRDPSSRELLRRLFPHTGRAAILGVTGSPGTGKSTLVDGLAGLLRRRGHTVGILAVDPSSPFTGGAILGDRVRMQAHSADPGVYIRSMATRGALGGLSAGTLDAAVVLDAAGKDYILVETVGVGQDEIDVMRLADVTLVVLVPGLGDDVQAFKAGIMEIADIYVLNKSDLAGADRVEAEVRGLLSVAAGDQAESSPPPICRTVAVRQEGLEHLLGTVLEQLQSSRSGGKLERRKIERWKQHLMELLRERMLEGVMSGVQRSGGLDQYAAAVAARETDPYSVADEILNQTSRRDGVSGVPPGGKDERSAVLDHVAIAVESLAGAAAFYERVLGLTVSDTESIPTEKTRVAMLPVGDSRIELMEPTDPDSPIARSLARRGPGLHHISLRVPDLDAAIERLRRNGIKIIHAEPGIGAGGHRYIFIHPSSAGGVLVELVEQAGQVKK